MRVDDEVTLATLGRKPYFGSDEEHAAGLCEPSVTTNADRLLFDRGSVSITSPLPFRFMLFNANPLAVPVKLKRASSDMCICKAEGIQQFGKQTETPVELRPEVANMVMGSGDAVLERMSFAEIVVSNYTQCSCSVVGQIQPAGSKFDTDVKSQTKRKKASRALSKANSSSDRAVTHLILPSQVQAMYLYQPTPLATADTGQALLTTLHLESPYQVLEVYIKQQYVIGTLTSTTDTGDIHALREPMQLTPEATSPTAKPTLYRPDTSWLYETDTITPTNMDRRRLMLMRDLVKGEKERRRLSVKTIAKESDIYLWGHASVAINALMNDNIEVESSVHAMQFYNLVFK